MHPLMPDAKQKNTADKSSGKFVMYQHPRVNRKAADYERPSDYKSHINSGVF